MKKILIFISTAILSVSLLCITAFGASASTVPIDDVIKLGYCDVYQLQNNVDYVRFRDDENNVIGVEGADNTDGSVKYQSFVVVFYYEGPDIKPYETVQFRLSWKMSGNLPWPFSFREIVLRDNSKSLWDFVGQQSVGHISFGTGGDGFYSCYSDISYTNTTNETIVGGNGAAGLTFAMCFKSSKSVPFHGQLQFFNSNVTNFYVGDLSSPNAPTHNDFSESVGNDVNDLKDKEDSLMNDTEQGRENTISLFQNFASTLSMFTVPLLAIKGLFDYLIADTVFEGILLISLTLGLLAFVFNIFPSIQARQHRERNAEAQRTKNAQYNAMMNKLNNHNKGGS